MTDDFGVCAYTKCVTKKAVYAINLKVYFIQNLPVRNLAYFQQFSFWHYHPQAVGVFYFATAIG
jgi:hypothetical protein